MENNKGKIENQLSSQILSLNLHIRNIEERDNLLFERNSALSVIIGLDGRIENANKAFLESLNYSKSEIIGQPLINFIIEGQKKDFLAQFEKGYKGEDTSELEVGVYAKDGSIKTVLFSSVMALVAGS